MSTVLDRIDRDIVLATQAGLPLHARPYDVIAAQVGTSARDVMDRLKRMIADGVIRRIGIVPNHYALGLTHNAMTVWDVDDNRIGRLGRIVGNLDFVSHCYHRPRCLPLWPFNLFAMVHGATGDEVIKKTKIIEQMLHDACRSHDVLVSTRILKKTGLRLSA